MAETNAIVAQILELHKTITLHSVTTSTKIFVTRWCESDELSHLIQLQVDSQRDYHHDE